MVEPVEFFSELVVALLLSILCEGQRLLETLEEEGVERVLRPVGGRGVEEGSLLTCLLS